MNFHKFSFFLASILLISASLACNIGASAPTLESEAPQIENATEEVIIESAPTNSCENLYFPVVVGATWNYSISGPVPDTYVHTILSNDSNTFVEQDTFASGVVRTGNWNCENGNLIALEKKDDNSANVNVEGVSVDFKTVEASGVTLPASINSGDVWEQMIFLQGTQTINGETFPASNRVSTACKAIGIESVSVVAGTFDAMRVECVITMDITLEMQAGNPTATTLNLNAVNWYAPNIGLVKNTNTGGGLDGSIELVSYTIP